MFSRVDQIAQDRLLPERLAGFQPVQAFDQDEPLAILPQQDRGLLADLQHAFGAFHSRFLVYVARRFTGT